MNGDDDEAEKTPPRTPSAQAKLGLVVCPKCEGTGLEHGADGITCDLCSGGRRHRRICDQDRDRQSGKGVTMGILEDIFFPKPKRPKMTAKGRKLAEKNRATFKRTGAYKRQGQK